MERIPNTIVEVTSWYTWEKLTLNVSADSNLDDRLNNFKTILTFLTFWTHACEKLDDLMEDE